MKRVWVLGVLVAALVVTPAGAQLFGHSKTFTATTEPRRYKALGRDWRMTGSLWIAADGHQFLAFSRHGRWCHNYGRYQDLRVKENVCDGRLMVTVRSAGAPTDVTFNWSRIR